MRIKRETLMLARLRSTREFGFLTELLMLVLGISIALWAEGRFEDYRDQQTKIGYLQGLRRDLSIDIERLEVIIEDNVAKVERLQSIVPAIPSISEQTSQEATAIVFEASEYYFFTSEDFTYMSMRESGDFRLLSSREVKENLLRLTRLHKNINTLQDNFIQAMDDEYIPLFMKSFDLQALSLVDQSLGDNLVFRNFFSFTLQDTTTRISYYKAAVKQTRNLVGLIEEQLDGDA
jgi:hypothetical protein